MKKHPSYEDLQEKIKQLEKDLSDLYAKRASIPLTIDPVLFYKISEYAKISIVIFESTNQGISFSIKYFNKNAEETEKVKREKVIGKNPLEIFPHISKSGFYDALKRVFETNISEEFPSTIIIPGNVVEWKHNYIYKLSDTEIVSIYIDETDKKNKEFELKLYQEKLQMAMEAANYYPFEINLTTNKITTNYDLYASLGYSDLEIEKLLQHTGSLIHKDDHSDFNKIFDSSTKKEFLHFKIEFRIQAKNGNWIWFMATGKNLDWNTNKLPIHVVGLLKNIQVDKEILIKLQESKENFSQLADNINDAFWLRSVDHKVVYANPACFKIVGSNFKLVFEDFKVYKTWIHPDDCERIIQQREKNLNNPDKNHYYEHRILTSDGEIRWLWIRTFPVYNTEGKLYRRAGIASDITEQKKLLSDLLISKQKAEESDKLKSAFLANMSHEIRTPMNGILGFAELLQDNNLSTEEKSEYLKIIDVNGKQLLNLINDIIDVAKIESSQTIIHKTATQLNPILKEIYQIFIEQQKRYKKQDIQFHLKIPSNTDPSIYTDIARLQQILNNLLSNAFKFTEYGSIDFGYEIINTLESNYFQFFVSDTGIGIDQTMRDFIFERFGQIQTSKFKNIQGTGLGLAISKGLIKLLDGKIWFDSVPENNKEGVKGYTKFYFTIPIKTIDNQHDRDKLHLKSKHDMKTLENIDILVVEDDEYNLEFLRQLLLKYGANVVAARSGEEAVEVVKSNVHIHVVLMDIRLPNMNGFETTQIIKKLKPELPIIAQTAYAMYNDKEICLENGCDDYISKPLDKAILFQKINQYIYT